MEGPPGTFKGAEANAAAAWRIGITSWPANGVKVLQGDGFPSSPPMETICTCPDPQHQIPSHHQTGSGQTRHLNERWEIPFFISWKCRKPLKKLATLESSNLKKVAVNHHSLPTFIGRPHVKDIEEALRFWGGAKPKHWEDQWFSIEQCAPCNQRVDLLGSPWCPLFCRHEGLVERHKVYPGRASSFQESGWKHHRICYENSI